MRLNKPVSHHVQTAEGAAAYPHLTPIQQLRRSVLACLLWENQFYEDGVSIADRIKELVRKCNPVDIATLAIDARITYKLRHAPLLIARELARHPDANGKMIGKTIEAVIQRADELSEFLSLYWSEKKQPLAKQVKQGLAAAFGKFDEYALAKYNRANAVKLRDVLFLCHAKPKSTEQEALWKRLINDELEPANTWENILSNAQKNGKSKKDAWEEVIDAWVTFDEKTSN